MPNNYVGNPNAIEPPSPPPGAGTYPTVAQPADGDSLSAASVSQDFKCLADFVAYLQGIGLMRPAVTPAAGAGNGGFTAVTHTGTGTGTVAPVAVSPTQQQPTTTTYNMVFKIIVGGVVGTATFQASFDGGFTFGATTATAATYLEPTSGITVAFTGTFVAADTYQFKPADTPQLQVVNTSLQARSIVDHLGYRTGRNVDFQENWFSALSIPASTAFEVVPNYAPWSTSTSANVTVTARGGSSAVPTIAGPRVEIAAAAAVAGNQGLLVTSQSILFQATMSLVMEFEANMSVVGANNFDFLIGLNSVNAATPDNSYDIAAILKQSVDTNWQALTSDGTTFQKNNTNVLPLVNAYHRIRIELHGSSSIYGALARFFINEQLVCETSSHLPRTTIPLFLMFVAQCTGNTTVTFRMSPIRMQYNRALSLAGV